MTGVYALQMNYSPNAESATDAQFDGPNGYLFLAWLDPVSGYWLNAANMSNTGGTDAKGPYQGSFADFEANHQGQPLADYVGYWGVNIDGSDSSGNHDTVWAVVDNLDGQFAVVPEPGTFALIGAAAVALLPVLLRRKLKQMFRHANS